MEVKLLPFLKHKQVPQTGVITKTRSADEKDPLEKQEDNESEAIMSCARALLAAVKADDAKGVADAIADAFAIMDSSPHEEADHSESTSYDSQNAKAAKGPY